MAVIINSIISIETIPQFQYKIKKILKKRELLLIFLDPPGCPVRADAAEDVAELFRFLGLERNFMTPCQSERNTEASNATTNRFSSGFSK